MTGKERKNFSMETIEAVFSEQGGACGNCGDPFVHGFEAHHKDGDCSNNSKANCLLLCEGCHDAKKYETMQMQKRKALEQVTGIIDNAIQGKMAGAVIDKLLDAVKLELSLMMQLDGMEHYEIPAKQKLIVSEAIAQENMKYYENGVMVGIQQTLSNIDQIRESFNAATTKGKTNKV